MISSVKWDEHLHKLIIDKHSSPAFPPHSLPHPPPGTWAKKLFTEICRVWVAKNTDPCSADPHYMDRVQRLPTDQSTGYRYGPPLKNKIKKTKIKI